MLWYDYENIFYEDKNFKKTVEIMDDRKDNFILHPNCEIIGDSTFHGLRIEEFEVPSSIKTIEIEAFADCQSLKTIKFNEGLEAIEQDAFMGCYCLGPSLTLPNSLTRLEKGAFAFCGSIRYIELSDNLKELRTSVFEGCQSVVDINFKNVEYICAHALTSANLEKIKLPITLKGIDYFAFDDCEIEKIIFDGTKKMFLNLEGGKEFYQRYKKKMEFTNPTLEKLLDSGFNLRDANNLMKNINEER